jgi:DENN domain-containing protein 5
MNQEGQLASRLWHIRLQPSNRICADCDASEPHWASLGYGVLICRKCAGAHRHIGSKSTRVVNVTLDNWTETMVSTLETLGNAKVNSELERDLKPHIARKPVQSTESTQVRRRFVQAKYVHRLFSLPAKDLDSKLLTEFQNDSEAADGKLDARQLKKSMRLVDYFVTYGIGVLNTQQTFPSSSSSASASTSASASASGSTHHRQHSMKPNMDSKTSTASGLPTDATDIMGAVYHARVLDYVPRKEHRDAPLPAASEMFVFPSGCRLERDQPPAQCFPFIMTKSDGAEQYGVCLKFWERISTADMVNLATDFETHSTELTGMTPAKHTELYSQTIYEPRVICIMSQWPFFDTYTLYVKTLYRVIQCAPPVHIEKIIQHIVWEVPVPPAGKTIVSFSLADQLFSISRPPPNNLPNLHMDLRLMFESLSIGTIVALVVSAAVEFQIVVCASEVTTRVAICEGVRALLFPFHWSGVYVPVLPDKLAHIIGAPIPFMVGVHPHAFQAQEYPLEAVVVDADTNQITLPATLPTIPEGDYKKLLNRLKAIHCFQSVHSPSVQQRDIAFPSGEDHVPVSFPSGVQLSAPDASNKSSLQKQRHMSRSSSRAAISEDVSQIARSAFLRLWVKLFGEYEPGMDTKQFIADAPKTAQPLLSLITRTQLFASFEQTYADSKNHETRYFREQAIAKRGRSLLHSKEPTPFLDSTKWNHTSTYFAGNPAIVGPDRIQYSRFPVHMTDEYFGHVHPADVLMEDEYINRSSVSSVMNNMAAVMLVAPSDSSSKGAGATGDFLLHGIVKFQALVRGYLTRCKHGNVLRVIRLIRNVMRRKLFRIRYSKATTTLQAYLRTVLAERTLRLRTQAAVRISAFMSMAMFRSRFLHRRHLVTQVQAVFRGQHFRRVHFRRLYRRMNEAACSLVALWHKLGVPLFYRSVFWRLFCGIPDKMTAPHLRLSIMRSEVSSLEEFKAASNTSTTNSTNGDYEIKKERMLLYGILKAHTSDAAKERMYTLMAINSSGKKRKASLLQSLWSSNQGHIDATRTTVQHVDNELDLNLDDESDHKHNGTARLSAAGAHGRDLLAASSLPSRSSAIVCDLLKYDSKDSYAQHVGTRVDSTRHILAESILFQRKAKSDSLLMAFYALQNAIQACEIRKQRHTASAVEYVANQMWKLLYVSKH